MPEDPVLEGAGKGRACSPLGGAGGAAAARCGVAGRAPGTCRAGPPEAVRRPRPDHCTHRSPGCRRPRPGALRRQGPAAPVPSRAARGARVLTIRPATPADIGAVDALLGRSYGPLLRRDYPPSTLVLALPRMARAQPALLASGRYFLAEEEGRLLGAGGWSPQAPGGGGVVPGLGHVRHVATDAWAVRRGVGRALMLRVMEAARAEGALRLSSVSTLTAVPFYEALGFRALRPVTLHFGAAPFAAVEMERDL